MRDRAIVRKREHIQWVMGRNTLEELLKYYPERIIEVWTTPSVLKGQRKEHILDLVAKLKIPLKTTSKEKLSEWVFSDSHQSFIAKIKPRSLLDMKRLVEKKEKERVFFLALDNINDPQNFGAILRVAECFNVDGILFSKNRGSDITPVVTKTACGATELLDIASVSNLAESLNQLKKEGFEIVVADVGSHCQELTSFDFPQKSILVMGSEGKGIQPLIKKRADHHITIPMEGKISSLNVAQSSAVLLYHWRLRG